MASGDEDAIRILEKAIFLSSEDVDIRRVPGSTTLIISKLGVDIEVNLEVLRVCLLEERFSHDPDFDTEWFQEEIERAFETAVIDRYDASSIESIRSVFMSSIERAYRIYRNSTTRRLASEIFAAYKESVFRERGPVHDPVESSHCEIPWSWGKKTQEFVRSYLKKNCLTQNSHNIYHAERVYFGLDPEIGSLSVSEEARGRGRFRDLVRGLYREEKIDRETFRELKKEWD